MINIYILTRNIFIFTKVYLNDLLNLDLVQNSGSLRPCIMCGCFLIVSNKSVVPLFVIPAVYTNGKHCKCLLIYIVCLWSVTLVYVMLLEAVLTGVLAHQQGLRYSGI